MAEKDKNGTRLQRKGVSSGNPSAKVLQPPIISPLIHISPYKIIDHGISGNELPREDYTG